MPGSSHLICGCAVVSSVLCSSTLRLFGMHVQQHDTITLERFRQLSIARAILPELSCMSTVVRCTTSMCWPPSAGQLWPGVAVTKTCLCCGTVCTVVALHLCAAKFLLLCLLVVRILSATRWCYLFRLAVLDLVVWSLFFLLLLLCLIFCLSLFFLAPPRAHFCKLLISSFFLISFLTVCYRSQLFSQTFP